jgi:hypothetical protein
MFLLPSIPLIAPHSSSSRVLASVIMDSVPLHTKKEKKPIWNTVLLKETNSRSAIRKISLLL